jgi:ribosomal protein S18 acetylase RimI-like enzyme
MKKHSIEIKFIKEWSEAEIVELYKAGGWWKDFYDSTGIKQLVSGSSAFAVAIDKDSGKAIGMGRIISDGISDAYIQDLVILQKYRGEGIGKQLVDALLEKCLSEGLLWIGLIAEPGQKDFYLPLGFKPMKKFVPMKYEKGE